MKHALNMAVSRSNIIIELASKSSISIAKALLPGTPEVSRGDREAYVYSTDCPPNLETDDFCSVGQITDFGIIHPVEVKLQSVDCVRDLDRIVPNVVDWCRLEPELRGLFAATVLADCWENTSDSVKARRALCAGLIHHGWSIERTARLVEAIVEVTGETMRNGHCLDEAVSVGRCPDDVLAFGWQALGIMLGRAKVVDAMNRLGITDPITNEGPIPAELFQEKTFISASELAVKPVPSREWHVEQLIPGNTVTLLGGDGGVGKSMLAMQLAVATSLGHSWLGMDTRSGPALYLSAEDEMSELHRRIDAIATSEGVPLASMGQLALESYAGRNAHLCVIDPDDGTLIPTPLYDQLDTYMSENKPSLVILDTLADLHGIDENRRSHARQFIGLLGKLAARHNSAVVLLAHPSLSGMASGSGYSGSTAWNGSVRSRLYLERLKGRRGQEINHDARRLTVKKANYGQTGTDIHMTWDAGVFVVTKRQTSEAKVSNLEHAKVIFMELLKHFKTEGRDVNHCSGKSFAPINFERDARSGGIKKRTFEAAMNSLIAEGRIRVEELGPPSRRRKRLVIAE